MRFVKTASYANAMRSKKEYSRLYSSFLGVDVSSDPATVSPQRFPYCINMWKDYKADIGEVVSTIPGYRKSTALGEISPNGAVRGIFSQYVGNEHYVYMHIGSELYWATKRQILESPVTTMALRSQSGIIAEGLDESISTGIPYSDKFLHLDGTNYRIVNNLSASKASDVATVPTIQFNGEDYMPRNILTNKVNHRFLNANLEQSVDYGLTYSFDTIEQTATVTGHDSRESIYIPSTVINPEDGKVYTVTIVGTNFIQNTSGDKHNVKSVVCAKTVTTIMRDAFNGCWANTIVVPGVTYIGARAFYECDNLWSLYLGKGLTTIGTDAFYRRGTYTKACVFDGYFDDMVAAKFSDQKNSNGENVFPKIYLNCRYVEADTQNRANITINSEYSSYMFEIGTNTTHTSVPYERGAECYIDTFSSVPLVEYVASRRDSGGQSYIVVTVFDKTSGMVLSEGGRYATKFPLSKGIRANTITMTVDKVKVDPSMIEENVKDGYVESISYIANGIDTMLKDNVTIDIVAEADEEYLKGDPDYKDFLAQTRYDGTFANAINHCTIMCEFDDRVFLGGNSDLPNVLFFCDRNEQGIYDPTYFGSTSYVTVGSSTDTCKVFITAPSYLTVIKDGNGSVYVLKPVTMEDEEYTRTYSITEGVSGVGAIGPGISFYDDKVFLSERGLDSITPSSIQLERSIVHRSLNIDRLLLSETKDDLAAARMTVWQGYLAMLVGSHIYLADSRALSNRGYEWFVLEDIYTWENDRLIWRYCKKPEGFPSASAYRDDLKEIGAIADSTKVTSVNNIAGFGTVYYEPYENTIYRVLVDTDGEMGGGVAYLPSAIWSDGEVLLVGFENGDVCIFNTDKRGESIVNDETVKEGDFSPEVYQRCGHAYVSGFATKLDNCDAPHLAKNTVKGSLVLKLKASVGLNARISCRTDRENWRKLEAREQENMISEIKGGDLDFTRIAFDLATFETKDDIHVIVREEKRRWIEKQYYIYTDRHKSCLAVKNIAYRYNVSGTIRDRDV